MPWRVPPYSKSHYTIILKTYKREKSATMFDQNVNRDAVNTPLMTASQNANPKPLRNSVKQALNNFLTQLEGQDPQELYELVLSEVEAPLLEEVMTYTRGNQTRAATMLGINRGTLRKKLKKYGMN